MECSYFHRLRLIVAARRACFRETASRFWHDLRSSVLRSSVDWWAGFVRILGKIPGRTSRSLGATKRVPHPCCASIGRRHIESATRNLVAG